MRSFVLLGLALSCIVTYAEGPDIRTLMTPEQFRAAGLDKLSPEELDALNHWIIGYTVKDAPEIRRNDAVVQAEVKKTETEGIKTRIVGEFSGWDGDTTFHLENGQIWRQRLPGRWYYRADSPEVELRKNLMGYWVLEVVGEDHAVGVKRLQ